MFDIEIHISRMPEMKSNLSHIKEKVADYLENFDFIINEDGVKFAKEKARELNRMADRLDTLRKEKVREVSAPIAEFDASAKEIHGSIKKARKSLLDQIEKFEAKTKKRLRELLKSELNALWKVHGVDREFQKAPFDDLVILSNMTKGGRVTKKAADTLRDRVLADKALQDKTSLRLLELEGISFKAGLKAPLKRQNIEHFLFDDDENYGLKLKELISTELLRQEEMEARINARTEEEARRKTAPSRTSMQSTPKPLPVAANVVDGGIKYTITVTLELVTRDMPEEKMLAAVRKRFAKAEFRSIENIKIIKEPIGLITPVTKTSESRKAGSLF